MRWITIKAYALMLLLVLFGAVIGGETVYFLKSKPVMGTITCKNGQLTMENIRFYIRQEGDKRTYNDVYELIEHLCYRKI